jgi:hypothetical protein
MGSSASPIVVVVLAVGWLSKWLRKDGRMDEGKKQAAKSKRRMQAAGVSRVPPRKRPRTKDDDDWGNKLAPMWSVPLQLRGRPILALAQPLEQGDLRQVG